ncbi:MAG TPA: hypothetical protein VKA74_14765, partial [Myxococcota bacterium]|nr:hypothetical protein [Myxococcota bacterium]
MGTRFSDRASSRELAERQRTSGAFGEWWAAIAVVGLAAITVLTLAGSRSIGSDPVPPPVDPTPPILAALAPSEESLEAVEAAFDRLCREPVLLALELEPDCETGVMTLPDELFDGFGGTQLRPEVEE